MICIIITVENGHYKLNKKIDGLMFSFILVIASTAEHSASLSQAHSRQMSYMQELQNLGCSADNQVRGRNYTQNPGGA